MRRTLLIIGFGAVLVALAVFGALRAGPPAKAPVSIIFISIDTLRPDHLGCYGYSRPTSPVIDAFCRDAVVFDEAFAHAPSTLISHASMLTSLIPEHHGATYQQFRAVSPEVLSLPEVLQTAGYATVGVTGGVQMSAAYGLGQGFDDYVEAGSFGAAWHTGLELVEARSGAPFFLFLHTYDVHHPYEPAPEALARLEDDYAGPLPAQTSVRLLEEINFGGRPISEADGRHIVATYDAGILTLDGELGRLFAELKQRGLYDDSLIVFTSDHGEEFFEHGLVGWHSHTLYDELMRVPLVVKLPGLAEAGSRVAHLAQGIDLAPTILGVAGLPPQPAFEGRRLVPLPPAGSDQDGFVVMRMEGDPGSLARGSGARTLEWKLFGDALYDLRTDPAETADVSAQHRRVVEALVDTRRDVVSARALGQGEAFQPASDLKDRLRSLGYTVR